MRPEQLPGYAVRLIPEGNNEVFIADKPLPREVHPNRAFRVTQCAAARVQKNRGTFDSAYPSVLAISSLDRGLDDPFDSNVHLCNQLNKSSDHHEHEPVLQCRC